jgi:subtilisin family serine protease
MDAIPEVRSVEEEDEAYWEKASSYMKANRTGKGRGKRSKGSKTEGVSSEPGVPEPHSWGLDRIDDRFGLDGSYEIESDGGEGVHIYVADTGIRTTHHDFSGRAVPTLEIRRGIIRECEASDSKCAQDNNGHGTHAAATVGGIVYGVAKSATIHSVKILSDTGRGKMSYLIQALDWVATYGHRPAIFTANVGGPGNPPSVQKAIEAAYKAGVTVIVAAGNLGRDACGFTPAHVKAAITVGATEDAQDTAAAYSNFGKCVDLFAPGSDIHSAGRMSDTAKATMTGTSMATPHVAGAAALLLGEDHTRTPEEVTLLLKARATQGCVQGALDGSPSMLLFTAPLEESDKIWWQSIWFPSWWKLLKWTSWADIMRPGPMKELMAEAFVCCLFLITLAFVMTRCVATLSLPPGMHEKA